MKERSTIPKLKITEVTSAGWNAFDKLFSARGSPKYCWCMAWRADQKDPRSGSSSGRKVLMKERISEAVPVGLLGYLNDEPVAWCSVAPFNTFRGLRKPGEAEETEKLWSVTCFFVRREHRRVGLARQLLAAQVTPNVTPNRSLQSTAFVDC